MVRMIEKSVCHGIAGKRSNGTPKFIVIHNDAGSEGATAEQYVQALGNMNNAQLENGFAHYYVDRNTIARVEDTYNMAWHTANSEGNTWGVGYEVCQSIGASDVDFLANEQVTFKQVAEDMKYWGMTPNRNTVRLHREFVATACPHRSWDLHGKDVNKVKDYFISQIKKYMNNEVVNVVKNDRPKHAVLTGFFVVGSAQEKKVEAYIKKSWNYRKIYADNKKKVQFEVAKFNQYDEGKFRLEKWLAENNWNFSVVTTFSDVTNIKNNDRPQHYILTGGFDIGTGSYKLVKKFMKNNKWNFTEIKDKNGRIQFKTGKFNQASESKYRLEKWLGQNNWSYQVLS